MNAAPARCTSRLLARLLAFTALLVGLLLAACSSRDGASGTPGVYRPATLSMTNTPGPGTPLPRETGGANPVGAGAAETGSAAIRATPTPPCENNLVYVEDRSIPDGWVAASGEKLDKRWLVQNSGTCNWDERYRLQLISGTELGLPTALALFPARGGSQAELRLLLTAPAEPGTYKSAWQAYDPQGQPFGDPVYVMFEVALPTETPTSAPG